MGVLQSKFWQGHYHSDEPLERQDREAAGRGRLHHAGEAGRGIGDDTLDTRCEPDNTGAADVLLGGDPK